MVVLVGVEAAAGGTVVTGEKDGSDDPPQAEIMAHSSTNPAAHLRVVWLMFCLLVGLFGMRSAGPASILPVFFAIPEKF